jgi:hypothetical protein
LMRTEAAARWPGRSTAVRAWRKERKVAALVRGADGWCARPDVINFINLRANALSCEELDLDLS